MSDCSATDKRISFSTFLMNDGAYAVDTTKVNEQLITTVLRAPEYLCDVARVRCYIFPSIYCPLKQPVSAVIQFVKTCLGVMSIDRAYTESLTGFCAWLEKYCKPEISVKMAGLCLRRAAATRGYYKVRKWNL